MLIDFLIFVFLGCMVGFLAGLFGIGGGALIVPILLFSYKHSGVSPLVLTHLAIGTSLFVIFFASITSAYQHKKQNNISWQAVFLLGFSSAFSAFVITGLAVNLSGKHLQIAFALITIIVAARMFTEDKTQTQNRLELSSKLSSIRLVGIGFTAGVVSGLTGVGGGGITIPMMYYLLRMPLKLAIGTSSATIIITALFSVIGYIFYGTGRTDLPEWSFGFVDLQRGTALVIGSFLTARIGAYVSFKTHSYYLRKFFATFLALVAVYILFVK